MTGNQLTYWKLKEEERSNKAREAETQRSNMVKEAETARHNVTDEEIRQVQNRLEERGLDIQDNKLVAQLIQQYLDSGHLEYGQLSDEMQSKVNDIIGANMQKNGPNGGGLFKRDAGEFISGIYKELKDMFTGGGARIISALF